MIPQDTELGTIVQHLVDDVHIDDTSLVGIAIDQGHVAKRVDVAGNALRGLADLGSRGQAASRRCR